MANKKRKITKEIENHQLTIKKYQKARRTVLRTVATTLAIAILLIGLSVFVFDTALTVVDYCIMAAVLAPVFICAAIVLSINNKSIQATNVLVAEATQRLRDWEQHLQGANQ